jgi:hypothetical protein
MVIIPPIYKYDILVSEQIKTHHVSYYETISHAKSTYLSTIKLVILIEAFWSIFIYSGNSLGDINTLLPEKEIPANDLCS